LYKILFTIFKHATDKSFTASTTIHSSSPVTTTHIYYVRHNHSHWRKINVKTNTHKRYYACDFKLAWYAMAWCLSVTCWCSIKTFECIKLVFTQRLSLAYPTMRWKATWVSPKIVVFPSGTLSHTLTLGDFSASSTRHVDHCIGNLVWSSQVYHIERPPLFKTRMWWCSTSCGFICNSWETFSQLW